MNIWSGMTWSVINLETSHTLSIWKAISWVTIYFSFMVLYTIADILIWQKLNTPLGDWLNLIAIIICSGIFIRILISKTSYRPKIFEDISVINIVLAVLCAIVFYFLLDKCLDPFFEGLFSESEKAYQESLLILAGSPITSFIHICILAPLIEETLIRGFVLGGLKNFYGVAIALFISTLLFAILHFNMVQTLSAVISGFILGLLYIKTNSLFSCILAHCGYNMISYFAIIIPLIE